MTVQFNIHYATQWGESLRLVVLQNNHPQVIEMKCLHHSDWKATVELRNQNDLIYWYELLSPKNVAVREHGENRHICWSENQNSLHLFDSWRWTYGETPFSTTVFKDIFFKRQPEEPKNLLLDAGLILQLRAFQIEPDRHFAVVGNQPALGNWDVSKKVALDGTGFPVWTVRLNPDEITFPLEYKYLLVDTQTDEVIAWGGGPNRKVDHVDAGAQNIVTDENFIRTIPSWKGAGVAIPVFSLRSKKSFGTGEFYDLKLMVDWAVKTGQKFIQTLPINDTILYHSNYDSYPYNAVSVYALHPIYLNLDAIGKIKDKERKAWYDARKKELNARSFSDYQAVMDVKWEYFKEIYPQEQKKVFASDTYQQFFDKNKVWLVPYAAFSYLRDLYGSPEFASWPQYQVYNEEDIILLTDVNQPHYQDIALYYFLQFHLHNQLVEVHNYARENGVAIKGDIPIGVSPRSVDAWVEPQLFNTNMQAGAPPDDFSVTGQNWGFPTYNWELMAKDNYTWWRNRFRKLEEYFDAYRIDHILGFFRIWEIPANDVWGLTGTFNPSLPYSVDELKSLGLWWDEERMLKPFLKEHVLQSIFGVYTQEVIREYMESDGWQSYRFKEAFNTQKKIEKHFNSLGYNFGNKEVIIRDGLYMLHCEVLFIRDARQPDMYHPRISMHSSATFRDLSDTMRRVLDRIYVDYYYHRHNHFWKEQAMQKLPALIASTNMLVCGEDLGMVPDTVPEVMNELEILSLEIQRMPKKSNHEFAMPADAPYLSVCTTSTHDMNPIRAWWHEDAHLTQRFYNRALGIQGPAPENCESWIAERIIRQHLESNAMLIILPWQDWMALESKYCLPNPEAERINLPSNPRNFWCYRMHIGMEDLLKMTELNTAVAELINSSGR